MGLTGRVRCDGQASTAMESVEVVNAGGELGERGDQGLELL
jgi:hypothetical protein